MTAVSIVSMPWTVSRRRATRIPRNAQPSQPGRMGISMQSDEVVPERVGRGRGARGHAELVEDVADVAGNRLLTDDELLGDLSVGLAGRKQGKEFDLPARQATSPA